MIRSLRDIPFEALYLKLDICLLLGLSNIFSIQIFEESPFHYFKIKFSKMLS